jgi:CubicO group peptidase (beta-lactamase class C family)
MIGSTGKTMTSMLIATLVDDGVVDWDTPVIEVLPRFAVADEALTQSITFRNLLCACTGVPRRDLEFLFSYEELSAEGVVESLRQFEFFTEFGEAFQYSNQLVATAGYAAAAAAGAPYGQLSQGYRAALDDRVLEPIGMHDTTLDFAEVVARGDFATPHQLEIASGEYEPIDVSLEALLTPVEPAGAHWSTAQDMAQYLITELNRGVNPAGGRVVSEENLFVTWQPQVPVSATESYGLGWMVGAYYGLPWIYHGGNTLGFTSEFVFLPEAGVGIAVFANAQGANAFTAVVAARLLELIYDQPSTVIAQSEFQVEQMARMVEEQAGSILDRVPLDEALTYFGAYDNAALGTVSLRLEGGQLLLDAGEWSTQLRPVVGLDGEPEGYVTYGAPITGLSVSLDTGGDGTPRMVVGDGLVQYEFERVR